MAGTTFRIRTSAVAALAALGLLLTGCSGDAPATAGSFTSATTGTAPAVAPATASPATTLDGTTAEWFTVFCAGVTPLSLVSSDAIAAVLSDPNDVSKATELFTGLGQTLTGTADRLNTLKAPTFADGQAFADRMTSGLSDMGIAFGEVATGLAAKDPEVFGKLGAVMADNPLGELDKLTIGQDLQGAVMALPACTALLDPTAGTVNASPTG